MSKIALVTTTINVPRVLELYRACSEDVRFFVVGDEKTPAAAYQFVASLGNVETYGVERQKQLGYKCSELLGWNNDSRRNVAILEALKWGADKIISVDDDMIPLDRAYFWQFDKRLGHRFDGLQLGAEGFWLDPGKFTIPPARARGLPIQYDSLDAIEPAVDAKVGVVQGIILGKPDTDAATNLTLDPVITGVHEVLRTGFVADPRCRTVFNSQSTAFIRELAPCMAQFYQAEGRNTDIVASLIARRVMRDRGLYTFYGPPMAYHARNPHDYYKDLKAEMWGLENIDALAGDLDAWTSPPGESIVDALRFFYSSTKVLPEKAKEAALAWLEDCESVL